MYWPLRTTPPSQSEIFSEKRLLLWSWKASTFIQVERVRYNNNFEKIFHFGRVFGPGRPIHWYEHREQATITDLRKYFTLGGCCGPERPIHTYEQREQATITDLKKYFTLGGCLVLKGHCIWTSYNNRKYFTLGGCTGLERPIHMNKLQ